MMKGRRRVGLVSVLAVAVMLAAGPSAAPRALPASLTDSEFWSLVGEISEPGGYFRITDNFTSNEREVGQLFTMLRERGVQGGVYLGVGPEQNFSYIASIKPAMAFVVDIRRQAVMQHLMFKAAFELSKDRADFISLLFSRTRPAAVDTSTPVQKMWELFADVQTDATAIPKNAARITDHLKKTHKFTLTEEESGQLEWVLEAFASYGPQISTRGPGQSFQRGTGGDGTFAGLTGWALDASGQPQSFLSSEENFRVVKTLHEKNLIIPVSGDFGGPKAIRAIGSYLKKTGGTVSAFYVSNVEQYLFQDGKDRAFYDNVSTLPMNDASVFIRPYSLRRSGGTSLCAMAGFIKAARDGKVYSNNDALSCMR